MAYDEAGSRLVIVGDNGMAFKAKTSRQLAMALTVSVWDVSSMQQPVMACMAGNKQVSLVSLCWLYGQQVHYSFVAVLQCIC